jgi:hypothetical protein
MKSKYKETKRKCTWLVVADYQPGNMWMTPDDTKRSRHETLEGAMIDVEKHQKAGACSIEVLRSYLTLEMK